MYTENEVNNCFVIRLLNYEIIFSTFTFFVEDMFNLRTLSQSKKEDKDQESIESSTTIVHTILRIGIIRALSECVGRRFRAATQHRH